MSKVISKASPVTEHLNKQLANWSVLHIKLSNYHWYVKGEDFFSLHVKFEELYSEAALYLDTIAERILSLRGEPLGTMKEHLANASIHEAAGGDTAAQMVKQLVNDFELLSLELTAGIESAEDQKDQPTADLLITIRTSIEKHTWMMSAYLGK